MLCFLTHISDGSKVEAKVSSAYICPYVTNGYMLGDGYNISTHAEIEAIYKALQDVNVTGIEDLIIFSDSMSVLQVI